jgi:hypothetical protein
VWEKEDSEWRMDHGERFTIDDLRLTIIDYTRFAQGPREKRVDFKKIFGTIIPNFGKVRTRFRVENGERRVEDG